MVPIKIVYLGSPEFAAAILEHLIMHSKLYQVVGVVTNPDKPVGRKQALTESPVARVANQHHLPLFKPAELSPANLAHIKLLGADIFLVAAFGKIIPPGWLKAPGKATLNIHFSLLPKYRGALCVSEAIRNGDQQTGVTLMEMDEQLDHGPIIAQEKVQITDRDDVATLTQRLTETSFNLIDNNLPDYMAGKLIPLPQDETRVTLTPSYKNRDHRSAFVAWKLITDAIAGQNATKVSCLIRSLNPDPGAWTKVKTRDGEIEFRLIAAGVETDRLVIYQVQLPAKAPINWQQFLAGHLLEN